MNILEQIEKTFELHEQGYSLREIAKEIGVSKSTVDRWLKAENSSKDDRTDFETPPGQHNQVPEEKVNDYSLKKPGAVAHVENSQYMLELRKMELQHEREMEILRQKDREFSIQELQQSNYRREMEIKRLEAFENSVEKMEEMKKEEKRIEAEKNQLLKRFLKLFKVYKEHATGYSWSIKEVKEFIRKLEHLLDDVESLSTEISVDYQDLAIWHYLDFYIDHFNDLLIENENSFWGGSSLKFDLSDDELYEIDSILGISDFHQPTNLEDDL